MLNNIQKILILNPAIISDNIGDFIIIDSVQNELYDIFKYGMFMHSITQGHIDKLTYQFMDRCDYTIVGGTNLLSSNMNSYNQWKIDIKDALYLRDITLMGVGWWQYQGIPNWYTRFLLKSILHKNMLHSVRDEYTRLQLAAIGIKNVINTGCPTMWKLSEEHCRKIPHSKAENVIFTITDYNRDPSRDKEMISILKKMYKNIYFWPQGIFDMEYFLTFELQENINIIPPSLHGYDAILTDKNFDIDYIGTRLHAGIRALQKKRRAIIIGIDNRAIEISKDFNLVVVPRQKQTELLEKKIRSEFETTIRVPYHEIEIWKNQFGQ